MSSTAEILEKKVLTLGFGASILTILASMPFIGWIKIVNSSALYGAMELEAGVESTLKTWYNLFNILTFVQRTITGSIGFYAMMLLVLLCATLYFHITGVLLFIFKRDKLPNNLRLLGLFSVGNMMSIVLYIATIGYVYFANGQVGMRGFALSPMIYALMAISTAAFILLKKAEIVERLRCREHGFMHELKKNRVLFAMLIPVTIFMLINSYLPMAGIYYGFTSFNFRDGLWASPFVGFRNFEYLLKADLFKLTKNTVLYNVVFIGLGSFLRISFAIMVSQLLRSWYKKTVQTLMFMPYFVSYVLLKVFVYNMFEYDHGLINTMMVSLGLDRLDFYNTPAYWPFLITMFQIWKSLGYGMIVYLATIAGISEDGYKHSGSHEHKHDSIWGFVHIRHRHR